MIAELRVRRADDGVDVGARLDDENRVDAFGRRPGAAAPTTAESRTPGCAFSARSTSSGKTFSPSGVTIISFLRPRMWS